MSEHTRWPVNTGNLGSKYRFISFSSSSKPFSTKLGQRAAMGLILNLVSYDTRHMTRWGSNYNFRCVIDMGLSDISKWPSRNVFFVWRSHDTGHMIPRPVKPVFDVVIPNYRFLGVPMYRFRWNLAKTITDYHVIGFWNMTPLDDS